MGSHHGCSRVRGDRRGRPGSLAPDDPLPHTQVSSNQTSEGGGAWCRCVAVGRQTGMSRMRDDFDRDTGGPDGTPGARLVVRVAGRRRESQRLNSRRISENLSPPAPGPLAYRPGGLVDSRRCPSPRPRADCRPSLIELVPAAWTVSAGLPPRASHRSPGPDTAPGKRAPCWDPFDMEFARGRRSSKTPVSQSYQIVIQRDGQTVATYPASFGNGDIIGDPNRVTRSGVHIVMDKQQTTTMSNPAYGYTNVVEHWAVRISDNGEFIHQNQNTVADQGNTNVSHGCINLSADNAQAYYESAIYGDPVEVTGTSIALSAADGDIYDWTIPWNQWLTMSSKTGVTS